LRLLLGRLAASESAVVTVFIFAVLQIRSNTVVPQFVTDPAKNAQLFIAIIAAVLSKANARFLWSLRFTPFAKSVFVGSTGVSKTSSQTETRIETCVHNCVY
jgi:hypothetical protein